MYANTHIYTLKYTKMLNKVGTQKWGGDEEMMAIMMTIIKKKKGERRGWVEKVIYSNKNITCLQPTEQIHLLDKMCVEKLSEWLIIGIVKETEFNIFRKTVNSISLLFKKQDDKYFFFR